MIDEFLVNRQFTKIEEKVELRYFWNNHSERRDKRSQKNGDDDITHKIKIYFPFLDGLCAFEPRLNANVHDKLLPLLLETSLCSTEAESSFSRLLKIF